MSADRPISKDEVAVLLASALGQHKGEEVVTMTASALGIAEGSYTPDDVRGIFEKLARTEGLVGVVARFALSRGDVDKLIAKARTRASGTGAAASPPPSVAPSPIDVIHLIAPALGVEKAREAIEQAAARRGLDVSKGFTQESALAVLDEMTQVVGIVGVVARFAKARFLLDPNA